MTSKVSDAVSDAMIEAGVTVLMSFPENTDLRDAVVPIYLAMKSQEASTQSPADEVERVARAMFDEVEVRRMVNPHMAPARWEDHREEYILKASAIRNGNERMREALEDAREAITSLGEDGLGWGFASVNGERTRWPLRDELLAKINAALDTTKGGGE